jgi:hypothetical protein
LGRRGQRKEKKESGPRGKMRRNWAGLERLRVFFKNFSLKPFQTLKLFKPYFFKFSNYFEAFKTSHKK